MPACSVLHCKIKSGSGFSLFGLPKNATIRAKWIEFLATSGKYVKNEKVYRICETHFTTDDVLISLSGKCLQQGAVPTIVKVPVSYATSNYIKHETFSF